MLTITQFGPALCETIELRSVTGPLKLPTPPNPLLVTVLLISVTVSPMTAGYGNVVVLPLMVPVTVLLMSVTFSPMIATPASAVLSSMVLFSNVRSDSAYMAEPTPALVLPPVIDTFRNVTYPPNRAHIIRPLFGPRIVTPVPLGPSIVTDFWMYRAESMAIV